MKRVLGAIGTIAIMVVLFFWAYATSGWLERKWAVGWAIFMIVVGVGGWMADKRAESAGRD